MKFCSNCFTKMKDEAVFCPKCGTPWKEAAGPQSVLKGNYLIGPVLEEAYEYTCYKGFELDSEKEVRIYEDTRPLRSGADEEAAAAKFQDVLSQALAETSAPPCDLVNRFCEDDRVYIILEEAAGGKFAAKKKTDKPVKIIPEIRKPAEPDGKTPGKKKPGAAKPTPPERKKTQADITDWSLAFASGKTGLNRTFTAMAISVSTYFTVFAWLFAWLGRYREAVFAILVPVGLVIASYILIRLRLLFANGVLLLAANASWQLYIFFRYGGLYFSQVLLMAAVVAVIAFILWIKYVSDMRNGRAGAATDGLNHPPMAAAVTAAPFAAAAVLMIVRMSVKGGIIKAFLLVLILAAAFACLAVYAAVKGKHLFCATMIMAGDAIFFAGILAERYMGMVGFLILLIIGIAAAVLLNRRINFLENTD